MSYSGKTERILVLGYGNELRGDDGLGPEVVRRLAAKGLPGVETHIVRQLLPEHAVLLADATAVIFVDARLETGGERILVEEVTPSNEPWGTHLSGPGNLLSLAYAVQGKRSPAWHVTIAGLNFDLVESLTLEAKQNAEKALEAIDKLIATIGRYYTLRSGNGDREGQIDNGANSGILARTSSHLSGSY